MVEKCDICGDETMYGFHKAKVRELLHAPHDELTRDDLMYLCEALSAQGEDNIKRRKEAEAELARLRKRAAGAGIL
jgi:hypothetical protein